jgi:hypothetical protein
MISIINWTQFCQIHVFSLTNYFQWGVCKQNAKNILSENLKGWEHLTFLRVDRWIILKWVLQKYVWVWTGFVWYTIGSSLSEASQWNFGLHKIRGISWLARRLSFSERCSMQCQHLSSDTCSLCSSLTAKHYISLPYKITVKEISCPRTFAPPDKFWTKYSTFSDLAINGRNLP